MAVIQKSKEYAVYFSRPGHLKIYDDDKNMIGETLDDITEEDDEPWNLNWDAEPLLEAKFSLSDKGKFLLYQVRTELNDGTCKYGESYIPIRRRGIIIPLEINL